MTLEAHIWFRMGWYRSKDASRPLEQWLRRVNRLAISGSRANAMGLQYEFIENGGTEHKRPILK